MPPEHSLQQLRDQAARLLRVDNAKVRQLSIVKKSVDARKKPDVKIVYTVDVKVEGNEEKLLRRSGCKKASIAPVVRLRLPYLHHPPKRRPVVVGFGPAGMFAALVLALAGCSPLVLERGADAQTRHEAVSRFFETGELDPECNVQFGEGGAGTFSDGKLNTGVNNPRIHWILEQFVEAGAQENILYDAKPHVGTDVLLKVVQNIRKRIISLGGEVRFGAHVTDILTADGRLTGLKLADGSQIGCDRVIFAIGHSARDTFRMLLNRGLKLEPKPFSMGVRIEHKQSDIDIAQYGCQNRALPPADYKLVSHQEDATVYTFCMCPGGYVVAAASEEGGVVTNGMSYCDRAGDNANAALLVTLDPKDFPYPGPLGGMQWQQEIEAAAFRAGGRNYHAPAQTVGDFLAGKASRGAGSVTPTYRPGVTWCDLHDVLPGKLTAPLERGIKALNDRLAGFSDPDAVLTAPETRSSSPVRILRDGSGLSSVAGLYPAGEGAGYAGGIMSAAIDGMMTAQMIVEQLMEAADE